MSFWGPTCLHPQNYSPNPKILKVAFFSKLTKSNAWNIKHLIKLLTQATHSQH